MTPSTPISTHAASNRAARLLPRPPEQADMPDADLRNDLAFVGHHSGLAHTGARSNLLPPHREPMSLRTGRCADMLGTVSRIVAAVQVAQLSPQGAGALGALSALHVTGAVLSAASAGLGWRGVLERTAVSVVRRLTGRDASATPLRGPGPSTLPALGASTLAFASATAASVTLLASQSQHPPDALGRVGDHPGLTAATAITWALSVVAVTAYAVSTASHRRTSHPVLQAPADAAAPQEPDAPAAAWGLVRSQGASNLAAQAQGLEEAPALPRAETPDPQLGPVAPGESGGDPLEIAYDTKSAREPHSPPSPDDGS